MTFGGEALLPFGGGYEGMLPVRRMSAATGGTSTRRARSCAATPAGSLRLGDPLRVGVERVEAARGRVDLDGS